MSSESHRTAGEECYEQLRRLLLHGQIPPDERLHEMEWSQRLGVYRGALRSAMRLLQQEGLLRRGPKGGYFVPRYTAADIAEVLEVRMALEIGAIRLMQRGDRPLSNYEEMKRACEMMEAAARDQMDLAFVEAQRRFHSLLVQAAGNERLSRVYLHAPLPLLVTTNVDAKTREEMNRRSMTEHWRMLELLNARRFDEAVEAVREHLLRLWRANHEQAVREGVAL